LFLGCVQNTKSWSSRSYSLSGFSEDSIAAFSSCHPWEVTYSTFEGDMNTDGCDNWSIAWVDVKTMKLIRIDSSGNSIPPQMIDDSNAVYWDKENHVLRVISLSEKSRKISYSQKTDGCALDGSYLLHADSGESLLAVSSTLRSANGFLSCVLGNMDTVHGKTNFRILSVDDSAYRQKQDVERRGGDFWSLSLKSNPCQVFVIKNGTTTDSITLADSLCSVKPYAVARFLSDRIYIWSFPYDGINGNLDGLTARIDWQTGRVGSLRATPKWDYNRMTLNFDDNRTLSLKGILP